MGELAEQQALEAAEKENARDIAEFEAELAKAQAIAESTREENADQRRLITEQQKVVDSLREELTRAHAHEAELAKARSEIAEQQEAINGLDAEVCAVRKKLVVVANGYGYDYDSAVRDAFANWQRVAETRQEASPAAAATVKQENDEQDSGMSIIQIAAVLAASLNENSV